jgi:two-component system chemotaxis response regulator CheB
MVDRGGVAVVQHPEDALYDGMPCAALRVVPDAIQAAGAELALAVDRLCREPLAVDDPPTADRILEMETEIPHMDEDALADEDRPGRPAALTCPDCNGAMFELDDGHLVRFRCRVGHAWSPETLLLEQVEAAEAALWAAIRTLEEKGALHRRLAGNAPGHLRTSYHNERAEEAVQSAAVLRDLLRRPLTGVDPEVAREAAGGR